MKVSKEEIVALMTALAMFAEGGCRSQVACSSIERGTGLLPVPLLTPQACAWTIVLAVQGLDVAPAHVFDR